MTLRIRRFQTRLLLFLLLPLLLVLLAVQQTVNRVSRDNAYNLILRDLQETARRFEDALADRNYILATAGDVLWDDYGFKVAYGTRDATTIDSALNNLLSRLGDADFIAFTDYRSEVVLASTMAAIAEGEGAPWPTLLATARERDRQGEYPEADDVLVLHGKPYHMALLPFFNPDLENWVTLGFEIDQELIGIFREHIAAEVSVLLRDEAGWRVHGSTLPPALQQALLDNPAAIDSGASGQLRELDGEPWVTLAGNIGSDSGNVRLLLQRSLAEELAPYTALERRLLQIFAVGLVVLMAGLLLISRQVTRPVTALASGARRIAEGDYSQRVHLPLADEVGQLASAFNTMAQGLAEKERVRNLLGKVVSPEIANELLKQDVELGGEERDVTLLFADVRGFTSLCEGQSPQAILALLNEYFSAVTSVIEAQGGVVDKYIGDAVMALFGAPLACSDAPARAVHAALGMRLAVRQLNAAFAARGLKPIDIGIGINSDVVVVGNMGSQSRLNYTAIGDGVNLASRLEGLTRHYGVGVIVSAQTMQRAGGGPWLELDQVRVKGKQTPVRIFEPLPGDASPALLQAAAEFRHFLEAWYSGDMQTAGERLDAGLALAAQRPALLHLYRERLARFRAAPPADWDGVYTFSDKQSPFRH